MALSFYQSASWSAQGTWTGSAWYVDVVVADAAAGDLLVAVGFSANQSDGTFFVQTQAGTTGSWTYTGHNVGNNCGSTFGWASVTATASVTVRVDVSSAGGVPMGAGVVRIPSGEWGGTPTITLIPNDDADMLSQAITVAETSTVVWGMADWQAVDRTGSSSYTPGSGTQRLNFFVTTQYSGAITTWLSQAAGSRAYGFSGASGAKAVGGVVVIPAAGGGGGPAPISLRAAGTATAATAAVTAVNPAVPAGTTTGDLSVLSVWSKPADAFFNAHPSGWTEVGAITNGSVAAAADTGSTRVTVYVRESATVGAIGNLNMSGANSVGAVINTYAKDSTGTWDLSQWTYGTDTTNAANYSATAAGGLSVATGDWVVQATAVNGDVGTQSAQAIGGMSGATLGTYAVRQSADTTTGFDSHGEIGDVAVTGGSSNAAPTFTYTNASNGSGTTIWLRLRQVVVPPVVQRPRNIRTSNAALRQSYTR